MKGLRTALLDARLACFAEWTKLRTLLGSFWLLLAVTTGIVALGATVTATVHADQCPSAAECFEDTTKLSLSGVHLGQLAVIVLAVLAVTNEYGTGMIRTTFAAMPHRRVVFAAKGAVTLAAVLVAGTLGVLASVATTRPILYRNGFTELLPLGDEAAMRAAAGTVLYLELIALLSLGAAALVRDAAVAIAIVVAMLYVLPILSRFINSDIIDKYGPLSAGLAVQTTVGLDRALIGPWAGLGVLAAWAGAAAIAGGARFIRSDT